MLHTQLIEAEYQSATDTNSSHYLLKDLRFGGTKVEVSMDYEANNMVTAIISYLEGLGYTVYSYSSNDRDTYHFSVDHNNNFKSLKEAIA